MALLSGQQGKPAWKPAADAFKAPPGLLPPKRADGALPGLDLLGVVAAVRQAGISEDHLKEMSNLVQRRSMVGDLPRGPAKQKEVDVLKTKPGG